MSASWMRAPWLAVAALGACGSPAAPSIERRPEATAGDDVAPRDARPGTIDGAAPDGPTAPADADPRQAARDHMIAVRDRLQLLALSKNGRRALLAVLQPVAHAPELRVVEIDTGTTVARVEMLALARLPKRPFLDEDPDYAAKLDAAVRGNRLLAEELADAGALLAEFGALHGGDFAASADGKHVAYTADEHGLRIARGADAGAARLDGGDDPWTAPDGTTLLFKDGDPYKDTSTLWAVPFAGGTPRRVEGTDHLYYHSDPIARPDGTLRVRSERHRLPCLVDIDPGKLRVVRSICLPRVELYWLITLAMSPSGDWVAWVNEDLDGTRSRLRVMHLATRKLVLDTAAVDFTGVLDDKQLLVTDTGRLYVGVATRGYVVEPSGAARRVAHDPALRGCRVRDEARLVCLRGSAVVTVDLAALPGTAFRLR